MLFLKSFFKTLSAKKYNYKSDKNVFIKLVITSSLNDFRSLMVDLQDSQFNSRQLANKFIINGLAILKQLIRSVLLSTHVLSMMVMEILLRS